LEDEAVERIRGFERELSALCRRHSLSMEMDGCERICLVDHKRPPFPSDAPESERSWPWVGYFVKANEFGLFDLNGSNGIQLETYADYGEHLGSK
jgi:hypothetical protein